MAAPLADRVWRISDAAPRWRLYEPVDHSATLRGVTAVSPGLGACPRHALGPGSASGARVRQVIGKSAQQGDSPNKASAGSHGLDDEVSYEFMTVKAIRGRENSAITKWQKQGWEFVDKSEGTLRSELTFRKVKAKPSKGPLVALAGLVLLTVVAVIIGMLTSEDTTTASAGAPITASATSSSAEPSAATPPTTAQTGTVPPTPLAESTPPSATSAVEAPIVNTTVDELVDNVNSAGMGGMRVGDRFRVTGELIGADMWTTGASGDFFVYLKSASGGDLIVFVEEAEAEAWRDGTIVEMVLENVEVTINGETTDGWFRATSSQTVTS